MHDPDVNISFDERVSLKVCIAAAAVRLRLFFLHAHLSRYSNIPGIEHGEEVCQNVHILVIWILELLPNLYWTLVLICTDL